MFHDVPTFSRTCIFFLLIFSLLTLPTSAFQLSILSEVSLLNFLRSTWAKSRWWLWWRLFQLPSGELHHLWGQLIRLRKPRQFGRIWLRSRSTRLLRSTECSVLSKFLSPSVQTELHHPKAWRYIHLVEMRALLGYSILLYLTLFSLNQTWEGEQER